MKFLFLSLFTFLLPFNAHALRCTELEESGVAVTEEFYAPYAGLLKDHVSDEGLVDYVAVKADKRLPSFMRAIQCVRHHVPTWEKEEDRLAFWINVYNAATLAFVVEAYPIESSFAKSLIYPKNSIRQIDGVWDKRKIGRSGPTLNEVEHEIIRKKFSEPRIHMALVCAALSCPSLLNQPYLASTLDEQLAEQSRRFVADKTKGVKSVGSADLSILKVNLSKIFKWFSDDFVGHYSYGTTSSLSEKEQAVLGFVLKYSAKDSDFIKGLEKAKAVNLSYFKYDWTLNEKP